MANFGFGTTGQVLTSNGAGTMPSFQASSGGGGNANAFDVFLGTTLTGVTGDGTYVNPVIYDSVNYNVGSNYNVSTGIYTIPTNGKYYFYATSRLDGLVSANTLCQGAITTTMVAVTNFYFNCFNASDSGICVFNVYGAGTFTAGDQILVQFFVGGNATPNVNVYGGSSGWQNFGGWQIA